MIFATILLSLALAAPLLSFAAPINAACRAVTKAPVPAPAAVTAGGGKCHDYMIFSSRGTGEKQGPTFTMTQVIAKTLAAVPNGIALDTVYPADWSNRVQQGADWITQQVEATLPQCPNTKVVLTGWSQGAVVAHLAAEELAKRGHQANIKAVYLVGDPYHMPGRPGNVDENGNKGSTFFEKGKMVDGDPTVVDVLARKGAVRDVCYTGDFACTRGPSKDPGAHGKYGEPKVQAIGADFLIKQLS
ncbi:hypothetical protein V8E36_000563 [Tilletia maclaganii]